MAAAPKWKVFDRESRYMASCHEIEAAACLVSFYGEGATIRAGHDKRMTVWTQGVDGNAYESYDVVAVTVQEREPKLALQLAKYFREQHNIHFGEKTDDREPLAPGDAHYYDIRGREVVN